MSPERPMQSPVDFAMYEHGRKPDTPSQTETAQPAAPQDNPPIHDAKELTLARFRQQSIPDKLWVLTQAAALLFCLIVTIISGCAYFPSDFKNCDDNNPYAQAFLSGMYSTLLCMMAWTYAYSLRRAGKELVNSHALSFQTRQRRRQRIPILLNVVAMGQFLAAVSNGLAAYRTSRAPLNVGFTSLAALVGMPLCVAAGAYNTYVAMSIRRSISIDAHVPTDVKATNTAEQSTSFCDMDLANLPSFDKQWLAIHMFAIVTLSSVAATSASLLWQMPCEDKNRKPLMRLSVDCFNHLPTMGSTLLPMIQMWLQRATGNAHGQDPSRFMFIAVQIYFVTISLGLGLNAYEVPSTSYVLILVKVQTAVVAVAYLVCSGFDYALMLKTNFSTAPSDAGTLEKVAGENSEQLS